MYSRYFAIYISPDKTKKINLQYHFEREWKNPTVFSWLTNSISA